MDWIGFGFEHYDGFGRYRTTENGMPIDSSVTVYGDPQGNDVDADAGCSGTGSLGSVPGGQRRREALHGALLVVLRVRLELVDPGRLHVRRDLHGGVRATASA